MSPPTTSLQLFGLDLRLLWQEFRTAWRRLRKAVTWPG